MEGFKDKKQPLTGVPLEKCRLTLAPGTTLAFKKKEYALEKIMKDTRPEGSFAVARDIIGKYPKNVSCFTNHTRISSARQQMKITEIFMKLSL
jgi:hypothetical protein